MNYTSIKTLLKIERIDRSQALEIRDILTGKVQPDEYCAKWIAQCYNRPSLHELKIHACDKIIMGYGVEYIPRGHNKKSPGIEYVNLGDTYTTTLMYVHGRYVVGCLGNIVEKGNYD